MLIVNLDTHQVLLASVPRDYYLNNPALGGMDKLTHLGNSGIMNTVQGLNDCFGINITDYAIVNFYTFEAIIDALGGIDIYNPYEFYSILYGGNLFVEGEIHLNGTQALAYVRERHNLSNGDFGRNEHQAIVLQALIDKVTSMDMLTNFNGVLSALQGRVLTSLSGDRIMELVSVLVDNYSSLEVLSYHLGGIGDYAGTASMGWDRLLYVARPIDSQIEFIKKQVQMMVLGESITQEALPEN
jgi:LCP family protein required for cell wall assembly